MSLGIHLGRPGRLHLPTRRERSGNTGGTGTTGIAGSTGTTGSAPSTGSAGLAPSRSVPGGPSERLGAFPTCAAGAGGAVRSRASQRELAELLARQRVSR